MVKIKSTSENGDRFIPPRVYIQNGHAAQTYRENNQNTSKSRVFEDKSALHEHLIKALSPYETNVSAAKVLRQNSERFVKGKQLNPYSSNCLTKKVNAVSLLRVVRNGRSTDYKTSAPSSGRTSDREINKNKISISAFPSIR